MSILPEEFQSSTSSWVDLPHPGHRHGCAVGRRRRKSLCCRQQWGSISGVQLGAMLADVVLKSKGGGTIAVPVSMPTVFEQIAARYGGRVIRTKVNLPLDARCQ